MSTSPTNSGGSSEVSSSIGNKMALQQNIELLRCLYHLDLFRRSIRKIRTQNMNRVKDLFNNLTVVMSDHTENNINPIVINSMINNYLVEANLCALKENLIYEKICNEMKGGQERELPELIESKQQFQPMLRYNLTKVCTTCATSTPMNGCVKSQYIISMEPIETLTFEEQIIASLDSNEFCEQSNCFGHQRTYRSLRNQPNIFTFDYKHTSTKLFKLHEFLNPSIVFETKSDCIYRITAITLSPSSSLVYHSRLNIWLFITNSVIKPMCSNFNSLKYNFNSYDVQLVFYTLEDTNSNVIYENWQTSPAATTNPTVIKPQLVPNHEIIDSEVEYYDSGISSYNSSIETHENPPNPPELPSTPRKSSLNNYATIKRNRSKSKNIIKSISVPNLTVPMEHLVKRKVSFNDAIQIEIDLNEEYNPHPILMKILENMKL